MPRIKLKVTHTHAGAVHFAGQALEVDPATASWLIKQGIGEVEATGDAAAAPSPSPTPRLPRRRLEQPETTAAPTIAPIQE